MYADAGRPAEADSMYQQAISLREKLATDNPENGTYQNDLATTYMDIGFFTAAAHGERPMPRIVPGAIEIREKLVRDFPGNADYQDRLAVGYTTLGTVQAAIGNSADAEVSFGKAAEIRAKLVPKNQLIE